MLWENCVRVMKNTICFKLQTAKCKLQNAKCNGEKMKFSERLKEARLKAGYSQVELAKLAGVTPRTIQNYEMGARRPASLPTVQKVAQALHMTSAELLGEDGISAFDAAEKGSAKAGRDVGTLVSEVAGLFAGGEISDGDKDAVMKVLTEAYWESKNINQKYLPKRYSKLKSPNGAAE